MIARQVGNIRDVTLQRKLHRHKHAHLPVFIARGFALAALKNKKQGNLKPQEETNQATHLEEREE